MTRSFFVPCLALGIAVAGFASAQSIQINRDNKTIAINTTDEATATADIAAITIGFEVFAPDAQSASAEGGRLSHAILEALHKAGVDDKAIESDEQGVERNTEFTDKDTAEQRSKRQYVVTQSWIVSATPESAPGTIRVAVAAGANKSGKIDWRLTDRKALQAKAAGNALAKAREVAARMADGLHVKLGALIYASNEAPNRSLYFGYSSQAMASSPQVAAMAPAPPPPPPSLEIRPQTIREEATVYAVFAIE
jgi:uncharacterized protein YggE